MPDIAKELIAEMKKDSQPKSRKRAKYLRELAREFVENNEKFLRALSAMTDAERIYFQSFAMEVGMKRWKHEAHLDAADLDALQTDLDDVVKKVIPSIKKRRRRASA